MRADIDFLDFEALVEFDGLEPASAQDVQVSIGDLEIDLSASWALTENVIERLVQGRIAKMIAEGIRGGTGKLVAEVAKGLERSVDISLPAPVPSPGLLQAETRLSSLIVDQRGVQMGLSLGFDGETDPARLSTPGPFADPVSTHPLPGVGAYEFAVDQSVLNNLLFAFWQTGQMDLDIVVPADSIAPHEPGAPRLGDLDVFVTPKMPPVITMLGPDRLLLTVGDLRVDGVIDSELGAANVSLAVGAEVDVTLVATDAGLQIRANTSDLVLDVLIAPVGMEREGTRTWGARLVEEEVLPKITDLLKTLEYPQSDLTGKGLGVDVLRIGSALIPTAGGAGALVVSGDLVFE